MKNNKMIKKNSMVFIVFIALQIHTLQAAEESKIPEDLLSITVQHVPKLADIAGEQVTLQLMRNIEKAEDLTEDEVNNLGVVMKQHQAIFTNFIDNDIYSSDGTMIHEKGDLLQKAILHDKSKMVSLLCSSKIIDIHYKNKKNSTALHLAAEKGLDSIVALLLDNDVEVNSQNNLGVTPLLYAVMNKKKSVIAQLIAASADPNIEHTLFDETALQNSTKSDQFVFKAFMQDDLNPLHFALRQPVDREIVTMLLRAGANPNTLDNQKNVPVGYVVMRYDVDTLKILIKHNVDMSIVNNGDNLLHHFIRHQHKDMNLANNMLRALTYCIDVNLQNGHGQTSLHHAARNQYNLDFFPLLLERGVNPNIQDNSGYTALHLSVISSNFAAIKILLERGVNHNIKDNAGNTAFHLSAMSAGIAAMKVLLESGVNPNIQDDQGATELHLSAISSNIPAMKVLLEYGVNPNIKDNEGNTALHLSAMSSNIEAMKVLLESGSVDVNINNNMGYIAHECMPRRHLKNMRIVADLFTEEQRKRESKKRKAEDDFFDFDVLFEKDWE